MHSCYNLLRGKTPRYAAVHYSAEKTGIQEDPCKSVNFCRDRDLVRPVSAHSIG